MELFHNIRTVARYEATILRRSWFFRLFSIGALFFLTIMNIALFSPIGDEPWDFIAIPSTVPLFNLYILNIGQAIVVIFLAADFLKRDKKVDTNEVLYTRSMSNFEYILGKTLGILRLFLGLDVIILFIALIVNIISNKMTVDIMSYFWYLLIICVPTIVFSLGLAFMLMSLIRNQAVTFLILLGIAAVDMFWLWFRFGSLFDYMAFGLPLYKSTVIGFDNPGFIINQRLIYFCLGMSFVFITILLFNRLPQSRAHTIISYLFAAMFFVVSTLSAIRIYSSFKTEEAEKRHVIDTNRQFENKQFVSLTDAYIDLVHRGKTIEASASLKFVNETVENIPDYIFSLNPGLKVTDVTSGGQKINFSTTSHIIDITPGNPLHPGSADSVVISYSGTIIESFCYPDQADNPKEQPYQIEMLQVHKRQVFLSDKYVLLIPESHWYPVPGLNYYPEDPARIKVDFTNYTLRVKPEEGLTAVSQGIMNSSGEYSIFTPESPLTGLTLAIGDYRSDTLELDTLQFITHYFPGNDYYKEDLALAEIRDTLPMLVSGIMRDLEVNFSTRYPFKTLSLVEVPVQFFSLPRMSTQTRAEVQPSMVLLPEKLSTTEGAGFQRRFTRNKKRMERENQVITDKELQVRIFNDFIRNTFISGENFNYRNGVVINEPTRYRLGPSFYFYKNNFYSDEYPVINSVFESHLQKVKIPGGNTFDYRSFMGGLSDIDRTNLIFRAGSFRELLGRNFSVDTVRLMVTSKGDYIFNLLRSKAGIADFNEYFKEYVEKNKFRRIDIRKFNDDIKAEFGFDFYDYLGDWFNSPAQPGFLFSDFQVNETVIDDRVRYKATFIASNPENITGIFNVSFRTGGTGSNSRQSSMTVMQGTQGFYSETGRGMEVTDISKIVMLGPDETKRISIILDYEPREMLVNTIYSKNIPGEITIPVSEIRKSHERTGTSDNEEVLSSMPSFTFPGEMIVDNEDPGFDRGPLLDRSPLKKLLKITNERGDEYQQVRRYNRPNYWQPVVSSSYFGKYVLSAVYTASGTGDRSVKWKTPVDEPGYYDIYCFIGKVNERVTITSGTAAPPPPGEEQRGDGLYKDLHYKIYHSEGTEEITIDFENSEAGWHNMGRYYLASDTATVELSNQSSGRVVIGDAIKWVRAK